MSSANFQKVITIVLAFEGGFSDDPEGPGGATNFGITRRTLADWRGVVPWQNLPVSAVQDLTVTEATAIYRANYWNVIQGDHLPAGIGLATMDYGVNSGPAKAARDLQIQLGVTPDGIIGPKTIAAAQAADEAQVINGLCARRLAYLQSLPTWRTFGKDWSKRVAAVRQDALSMAASGARGAAPSAVGRAKAWITRTVRRNIYAFCFAALFAVMTIKVFFFTDPAETTALTAPYGSLSWAVLVVIGVALGIQRFLPPGPQGTRDE